MARWHAQEIRNANYGRWLCGTRSGSHKHVPRQIRGRRTNLCSPGDLLVKVRLDRDSLKTLCDHMNGTLSLHDQPVNRPTLRNRSNNVNMGRMFISEGNEPKLDFIGSVDSLFLESLFNVFI